MLKVHNRGLINAAVQHGLTGQQAIQLLTKTVPGLHFPERLMLQNHQMYVLNQLKKYMEGGLMRTLQLDMAKNQSVQVMLTNPHHS